MSAPGAGDDQQPEQQAGDACAVRHLQLEQQTIR